MIRIASHAVCTVVACGLAWGVGSASARAATIANNVVTEDFTTLDYADYLSLSSSAATTGVWDIANNRARAHVFADGMTGATRPVDFGNGADGVLSSSTGYTFDTDSHPNGFNFISVSITGGTVTVTGRNRLIIRSLSTMTITPSIDVSGPNGSNGVLSGATNVTGPLAVTCAADGGFGGAAAVGSASNGGDSHEHDGTASGNGLNGQGVPPAAIGQIDGQGNLDLRISNDFETSSNFTCGTSGPGGGGLTNLGGGFASGAAGGAGGGVMKLVSVGNMSVGPTLAKGGWGGDGVIAYVVPSNTCSGNGSAGNGGAVWMQTLGVLTTSSNPDVTAGDVAANPCGGVGSGPSSFNGFTRGDSGGARPAWATAAASYDAEPVPAGNISVVQSRGYQLGVLNAGFSAPVVTSSGTVTMEYAGSRDGTNYDAWTTDLVSLSDQDYRFVRWRATLNQGGSAGASAAVTRVEIPFSELGLTRVDFGLAAGCGVMQEVGSGGGSNSVSGGGASRHTRASDLFGSMMFFAWVGVLFLLSRMGRRRGVSVRA